MASVMQPVAEVVREQEHAMAAEKPRAVDDVGVALDRSARSAAGYSSGEYSRSASWMITRSPVTAAKPRRSAAPLPALALPQQREAELLLQPVENLARAVGRSVVDDDQLDAQRDGEHAPDDFLDRGTLVVHRHDDRQQRIGGSGAGRAWTSKLNRTTSAERSQVSRAWSFLRRTGWATPSWRCRRSPTCAARSPEAAIAVAARASIAPLFAHGRADVDEVDRARRATGEIDSRRRCRRRAAAAELVPLGASSPRAPAFRERWGYRTDWRGMLLTRAIDRRRRRPSGRVLPAPGARARISRTVRIEPRLEVSPELRDAGAHAAGARRDGTDATPLVALAPGAAYGGAKRWPPESFAALADALAADGVQCVLVGSAADAPGGARRRCGARRPRPRSSNLVGRTDLPTLAGVLAHCRALVTNDSGAMHLAAALGVAGDRDVRADRRARDAPARRRRTRSLTHPVWCRPCMLRECPLDHRCMRGIERRPRSLDAARCGRCDADRRGVPRSRRHADRRRRLSRSPRARRALSVDDRRRSARSTAPACRSSS